MSNPDPFAREPRRLLALVPRYQSPGRGHDPPPGHVVVAAGEDVADGPSGAGGPGLRGDLAVGHHLAWPKRPEHPQRASLEGVAASAARGLARGAIFTHDGFHIATVYQEALLRVG